MNVSAPFVRRPIMTILAMVTILFFGFVAYRNLPVSDLPDIEYPTIEVQAWYPGANPDTMANNVTSVLEQQFLTIEGIHTISSTSKTGSATMVLQFVLEKSIDSAAQDVQAAINASAAQLPQNLPYSPTYQKVNPTATPILFLSLHSATMTHADLYNYAKKNIGQHLSIVNGVASIALWGSPYAVRVQVDPQKLAAKNIGLDEVAAAIKSQNIYEPVGVLYGSTREVNLDVDGQIRHADGYNSMIIKNKNGAVVRIRDIGRAMDNLQTDKFYLHFIKPDLDEPCVIIGVSKQPGSNTLQIMKQIDQLLPELEKQLPGSVKLEPSFDLSTFIKEAIFDVQFTLFLSIALVVMVIFIYLGKVMNTIIPALAIPLSIMGTFIVLSSFGYSVDILSLLAITLSVGFLVDDAIVVIENVVRHVEHGERPIDAAFNGSKEISMTIVSMTICLAAVFIPFLFMKGIIGRLLHEFSITIISAVLLSGIISLTLTPMLCSRLIPTFNPQARQNRVERFSKGIHQRMIAFYKKTLLWSLSHRIVILSGGILCLIGSIVLFLVLPREFLPGNNAGAIEGFTIASESTSPFQMFKYQEQVNEVIKKNEYYDSITSLASSYTTDNQGIFFIDLKPPNKRPDIQKIMDELAPKLFDIPGLKVYMKAVPLINLDIGTSASKGQYQYTLQSLNSEDLYKYGPILFERIKRLSGFTQVYSDLEIQLSQLKLHILRDRASVLNITAADIENTLGYAFADGNLSPINEPDNQFYVIMEVLPKFYNDPSMLSQLYVRSSTTGKLVPLNQVVEMKESVGPLNVNHINGFPSITISFSLRDIPLSTAITSLDRLAKEILPPSITGKVQGAANIFLESFSNLGFLLMITFFIIYIILGILYENFLQPITVMSTLPPAAFGGLLCLLIFQQPISLYSFLGIILLLGIVLKNGIIMIEFANVAVAQGKKPHEAIEDACLIRFRPILMTTLSALMGAVPIAIGFGGITAEGRAPLGIVIIGGLILSQILTLYLTPVTYLYLEELQLKIDRWRLSREKIKDGDGT
ncbi:MAG TPA: efflux RND transporter permease subunit [Rhabdochlamydiaceae bacterium]|nr:efflux RND transporter permease subunit [Rhabdochlamydiaceae bacterium]